jgi:ParB family chromosome partitioning protein
VNAAAAPHVAPATRVDPRTLVLAENVRRAVVLDTAFKRDVAARGVRQPIEVRLDPLGQLLVVTGQRRTLAALEAGLAEVPVVLIDDLADEADRIVEQLGENHHRAGITAADDAAAVKQLVLFGLSPAQIAKRTARPKEEVTAALALADASEQTRTALADVDLVTAAKIAEFDGDEQTVTRLTALAADEPQRLDHEIEWARRRATERAAIDVRRGELVAQGVTVLDEAPRTGAAGATAAWLSDLTDQPKADGTATPIDPAAHQLTCPGHAVHLPDADLLSDGSVHVREHGYCLDWQTHGHFKRSARNTATATSGPRPEDATAERRRVRENNKAAEAAIVVRRRFIREHVLAKATAGNTFGLLYAADMLKTHGNRLADYAVSQIDRDFGIGSPIHTTSDAARHLVALAAAIGEAALHREFWRQPAYGYSEHEPAGVIHLQQLRAWGYALADVEQEWLDAYLTKKEA